MLIRLNDGTKFEASEVEKGHTLIRNRNRGSLDIKFKADQSRFDEIKEKFTTENLSKIQIFYPDLEESVSDDILFEENGPAHETFEYYDIVDVVKEFEVEVEPETATTPGVWDIKLSIQLGESLLSEREPTS